MINEDGETYNLRFSKYATHMLVGPPGSGKSFRMCNIIRMRADLIEEGDKVKNVVFCYEAWQKEYDKLKSEGLVTNWYKGCPSVEEFISLVDPFKDRGGSIVVCDDVQSSIGADLDQIVRVVARHFQVNFFLLLQSLFPPAKFARQISLSVKYAHIHKNPRENAQVLTFCRQLLPQSYRWIVGAYHEATKSAYGCFLVDIRQECEPSLRFRSHYLPNEWPMRVYQEKKGGI